MGELFLPGLPEDLIRAVYENAPGNEIESGKFASPESSAALVANTFGIFLNSRSDLPPLPGLEGRDWHVESVQLEAQLRFPWRGGLHPWLDVLVDTKDDLVGIESKRYETFRAKKEPEFSKTYWRPVWGDRMNSFEQVRNDLQEGRLKFEHLDATQLVKHAFGLRTAVQREGQRQGKRPILYYLFAEPERWPDGRPIPETACKNHRAEIERFAKLVAGDEVGFRACSYRELLAEWSEVGGDDVRRHTIAVRERFAL
ncbi:MAG: hypothetical protein RH942_03800 [Kiloniellaceae bacterium]